MSKLFRPSTAAMLLSASLLFACTGMPPQASTAPPPPNYPDSVRALVAAAKKEVKVVKMDEFKAMVDQKKAGLILDVRQENEYEDGFVPGAVNMPRGLIEFRIWKELGYPKAVDMNTQLTLYCASGGRCALASKSLKDLGFTNVTSVDMMFANWVKAGYPVAKPQ